MIKLIIDVVDRYEFILRKGNKLIGVFDDCIYYKKDYGVLVKLRNEFSDKGGIDIKCNRVKREIKKITCIEVFSTNDI